MKALLNKIKFLLKEYLWIVYTLTISEFFFINKFLVSGFSSSPTAQFVMNVCANLCILFLINIFFNKKITLILFSIFILIPNFFENSSSYIYLWKKSYPQNKIYEQDMQSLAREVKVLFQSF